MTTNLQPHSGLVISLPREKCHAARGPRAVRLLTTIRNQFTSLKQLPLAGGSRYQYKKLDPTDESAHMTADELCAILNLATPAQLVEILGAMTDEGDGVSISLRGMESFVADLARSFAGVINATASLQERRLSNELRGMAGRINALATAAEGSFD